jgi:hypothetical protein
MKVVNHLGDITAHFVAVKYIGFGRYIISSIQEEELNGLVVEETELTNFVS